MGVIKFLIDHVDEEDICDMSHIMRKPVFRVGHKQVGHKQGCTDTEDR